MYLLAVIFKVEQLEGRIDHIHPISKKYSRLRASHIFIPDCFALSSKFVELDGRCSAFHLDLILLDSFDPALDHPK